MMRLIVNEGETGYDVVGKFVEDYVVAKANETESGIIVVSGTFIVQFNPMYDLSEENLLPENEVLDIDLWGEPCWDCDWWDGQPIIDVLGITAIEDVEPKWRV